MFRITLTRIRYLKNISNKLTDFKIFDNTLQIQIHTDTSSQGMGAYMMLNRHPISFASRSLNKTQVKYAQIEKELLSIVFLGEEFHYWIYGRQIVIKTDHKPLISIFQKNLENVSARLQRMLLRLQKKTLKLNIYQILKMLQRC